MSTFCVYPKSLLFSSILLFLLSFSLSEQNAREPRQSWLQHIVRTKQSFTFGGCCGKYSVLNPCEQWQQCGGLWGTEVSFGLQYGSMASIDPPLWSRMKYLYNNYWEDSQIIVYRP